MEILTPNMLKRILISLTVGMFINATLSSPLLAKGTEELPQAKEYSPWAFVAGPSLYSRAAISPRYGDYTFTNKPIPSYCFGVMYTFHPEQKWSFSTGLLVNNESTLNLSLRIKKMDLFPSSVEDLVYGDLIHVTYSISTPLLLEYNTRLGNKTRLTISTGLKAMFFAPHLVDYIYEINNAEMTESREVFGLRISSQDCFFHGSYVAAIGPSCSTSWGLLKVNLMYVINFQNTFEGEYQFANLLSSPDSRGYYKLSGNYIGLLFSVNLKKRKAK